jgi:hypothetical protein
MLNSALFPWQAPWMTERLLPVARILGSGLAEAKPATRFNSVVSQHRVFETRRFTEEEFAVIAAGVPGASIEDAVISVCGGALRLYLGEQAELPVGASLNAMVWLPAETGGRSQAGQQACKSTWRPRTMATDIADPMERLAEVYASRSRYPAVVQQPGIGLTLPATTGSQPATHCIVRFIPVPQAPQYLCGARMSYTSVMLPIRDGMGLAFAVTRYDGRVIISPTSCRELIPDPERFAQCLRDSFQASLAQAQQSMPRAVLHASVPG